MTDLIATLEGLTSPSREVDALICRQLAGNRKDHWYDFLGVWTADYTCPELTASLDAITALIERVLPGWAKGFDDGPETCIAFVDPHDHTDRMFGARYTARGPTPAIALCIALFRALEARDARD